MKRMPALLLLFVAGCGADVNVIDTVNDDVATALAPTQNLISFDVVAVTSTTATLAWRARRARDCTFAISGGGFINVDAKDTLQIVNAGVPGPETYTLTCTTRGADPQTIFATRSVLWGDASSVQDLIGMRATTGSLIAHTDDFQSNFDNAELKLVAGSFEIVGDPASNGTFDIAFSALTSIGGELIIVDNAGFASLSMDALRTVGTGIDFTNNVSLASIDFDRIRSMGTTSTFAAQLNPLLSCEELADVYCSMRVQGNVLVADNEDAQCPGIVPGC
jgi:hypothetical protein